MSENTKNHVVNQKDEDNTVLGNPRKPQGKAGEDMLKRMNESHYEVTGWALEHFDFSENDKVLDIGCGGGLTLNRMSKHIKTGFLTGVDYSSISVATSKEMNREEIASGIMEIVEASVEDLPFQDNQFDKIITVESFYFWPNPVENLKEVRRVLNQTGVFLLVADIYEKEDLNEVAKENIKKYNLFNPTKERFYEMFQEAGFSKIQIHTKEGEDWICVEGMK